MSTPIVMVWGEGVLPFSLISAMQVSRTITWQFMPESPLPSDSHLWREARLLLVNFSRPAAAWAAARQCQALTPALPLVVLDPTPAASAPTNLPAGIRQAPDLMVLAQLIEEIDLLAEATPLAKGWVERVRQALGGMLPGRATPPSHVLHVRFFGCFGLVYHHQECVLELNRREKSLLAYLLYHAPQAIHKDRLAEQFWPDSPPDSARNLLHVALSRLRRTLARQPELAQLICFRDDCYRINPDLVVDKDFSQFQTHFQQALSAGPSERAMHSLVEAYRTYRGSFLEDLYSEPWVGAYRDALEESYLDILLRLGQQLHEAGEYTLVVNLCQRILVLNQSSEKTHYLLMRAYYAQGDRDKALRQFERYQAIARELRLRPAAEIVGFIQLMLGVGGAPGQQWMGAA